MNLLLIDDNALVRASLAGLLCDLFPGLTVIQAASCEAARRITDVHFTHVLVDFHLSPVAQAGFAVCEPGQEVLEGWECLEVLSLCFPAGAAGSDECPASRRNAGAGACRRGQ